MTDNDLSIFGFAEPAQPYQCPVPELEPDLKRVTQEIQALHWDQAVWRQLDGLAAGKRRNGSPSECRRGIRERRSDEVYDGDLPAHACRTAAACIARGPSGHRPAIAVAPPAAPTFALTTIQAMA
jgi:hypothetical protein